MWTGLAVAVTACIAVIVASKAYYPAFPLASVSKHEVLALLNNSNEPVVKVGEDDRYEWYVTRMNKGEGKAQLINYLERRQYSYTTQDGGGLFFEKAGKRVIVSTQMWTGNYMIGKVPIS